jgi:hypothetical protein
MTQNLTNEKQSIIGLFYDPKAKDRQEIIVCPTYDVKPLVDLDPDNVTEISKISPMLDKEVCVHLVKLVIDFFD